MNHCNLGASKTGLKKGLEAGSRSSFSKCSSNTRPVLSLVPDFQFFVKYFWSSRVRRIQFWSIKNQPENQTLEPRIVQPTKGTDICHLFQIGGNCMPRSIRWYTASYSLGSYESLFWSGQSTTLKPNNHWNLRNLPTNIWAFLKSAREQVFSKLLRLFMEFRDHINWISNWNVALIGIYSEKYST